MQITVQKIIKGIRYMKHYGFREFVIRLQEKMEAEHVPYEPWYERHAATKETLNRQKKTSAGWKDAPVISIVVPLYRTKETFLREMIASVQAQSYEKWQLCLADASGEDSAETRDIERIVRECAGADARICYGRLPENRGIAENTNMAARMATGAWIAFMDHDDLLAPDALYEAVSLMRRGPVRHTPVETAGGLYDAPEAGVGRGAKPGGEPGEMSVETADGLYDASETGAGRGAKPGLPPGAAGYEMIYTDEDKVDMDGATHFQPHLKPDFNIDLLRSNNYITHFVLVTRDLFDRVGGLRSEYDGAQDYDFVLRCAEQASAVGHVPRILYHWRCHKDSTSENPFSKQYAVDAGKRAIEAHLARLGTAGEVTCRKDMGFYTVRYACSEKPLISIVIPTKDEVETLKQCLATIEKSTYANYEVILVENNSRPETFAYYQELAPQIIAEDAAETAGQKVEPAKTAGEKAQPGETAGRNKQPAKTAGEKAQPDASDKDVCSIARMEGTLPGGQRICVAVWKEGFHYSKLNNFGVSFAKGEYLLLLNNDIGIISADWLEVMLGTCLRREVGVVGAKLYYPDDTIQHAGIVVGIGGNARGIGQNMFAGEKRERSGYLHKASIAMDYSAVTAACMMVKRSVYERVGGFTEELAVAFNDVDFCLKVRSLGYLVVYQPAAEAYHYESKSRGSEDSPEKVARFQREIEYMRSHWIGILKNGDPYYNPNFSAVYPNYSLRDNSQH